MEEAVDLDIFVSILSDTQLKLLYDAIPYELKCRKYIMNLKATHVTKV